MKASILRILTAVALFFLIVFLLANLMRETQQQQVTSTDDMMKDITNKVATDAVEQFRIAERQGNKMQICVQAGLVAAAYLQAKAEGPYQTWKATEERLCRAAGVR